LGSRGAAVKAAVNPFAQANDVSAARAAFGGVSDAILRLASASGLSFAGRAEIAYCPMARKYWLQKGSTVQNPYYGKQMSDCGRIAAKITQWSKYPACHVFTAASRSAGLQACTVAVRQP